MIKIHDTELNEDQLFLLAQGIMYDGTEVERDMWVTADSLVKLGLIELSAARGPGGAWKRATLTDKTDPELQDLVLREMPDDDLIDVEPIEIPLKDPYDYWYTRDNEEVLITAMTNTHLKNTIWMLQRNGNTVNPCYPRLIAEAKRRDLDLTPPKEETVFVLLDPVKERYFNFTKIPHYSVRHINEASFFANELGVLPYLKGRWRKVVKVTLIAEVFK